MKNAMVFLVVPALLAACGESPVQRNLVVDGTRDVTFERDRQHCIQLAENYDDGRSNREAAWGAVIGGVVGAADDDLAGAVIGTAVGGTLGKLEGEAELDDERRDVLIRCMQNRGHAVIG